MPRDSVLVVRPIVDLGGVTSPDVPAGWTDYQVEANGWITYWPAGRAVQPARFVHVFLCATGLASSRACFLFTGPTVRMDNIRDSSFKAWEGCPAMRADGGTVAVNVRANWYDQSNIGYVMHRMAGFRGTTGEARVVQTDGDLGENGS